MFQWFSQPWYSEGRSTAPDLRGTSSPLLPCRVLSSNVLSLTDAVRRLMDFSAKLDQARTLADVFELVKRAVEAVLGRTRAGLMLALADLGNHPQGFLGAFYPVASNVIVMNKVPLLRIEETNPRLYKPYAFYVLDRKSTRLNS